MNDLNKSIHIFKVNADLREVTGCVLIPEIPDAQGDIISEGEIQNAAHAFMLGYRAQQSEMGLMHKKTTSKIVVLESYCAPVDMTINNNAITKGSWVLKVRVNDNGIWAQVKSGELQGFSIGGRGKRVEEN